MALFISRFLWALWRTSGSYSGRYSWGISWIWHTHSSPALPLMECWISNWMGGYLWNLLRFWILVDARRYQLNLACSLEPSLTADGPMVLFIGRCPYSLLRNYPWNLLRLQTLIDACRYQLNLGCYRSLGSSLVKLWPSLLVDFLEHYEEPAVHILVDIPGLSAESGIFTLAQNCHSWSVGSLTGWKPTCGIYWGSKFW